MKNAICALVVSSLLLLGAGVQGTTIIMDATHHNGSFSDDGIYANWWHNGPQYVPAGWQQVPIAGTYIYNGALGEYAYPNTQALNNTGEMVTTGSQYTVSFGSGASTGNVGLTTVSVSVVATQNSDGTGDSVMLTNVSRTSLATDTGYAKYTATGTGSIASASLDGYYVQVHVTCDGNGSSMSHVFDDIVVTSEIVPEPATLILLLLGGLFLRRKH